MGKTFTLKWKLFKEVKPTDHKPVIIMDTDGYLHTFMSWHSSYRTKANEQWSYLPITKWLDK